MSEKSGVELSQYGAGKKAVHESLRYIRDYERIKPWAKRFGYTLLGVSCLIVFLKEDPPKDSGSDRGGIPDPVVSGAQSKIDFDGYNRGDDVRRINQQRSRTPQAPQVFSGPKLIARSNKVKVPPGTEAKAVLVSGASNGLVKVKLLDDVSVAGENFLQAGTILIGQGSSSEERLFVHFTKAVTEDGSVSTIEGEIADAKDRTVGLKGSFWARSGGRIVAGASLNFIAGASDALQDKRGEQGAVITKPTLGNAALNGTARAAIEESKEIASKYKNSPPPIEIRAGTEVAIIFTDSGG